MYQYKSIPKSLSVGELFNGQDRYIIPMYQRNYAWEEGEITQLIEDVLDYQKDNTARYYHIGSLVVFKRMHTGEFEVIDGQQRLTTLSLLIAYLRKESGAVGLLEHHKLPQIDFECRENSRQTLNALFDRGHHDDVISLKGVSAINHAILNGYKIIHKVLHKTLMERKVELKQFVQYLLNFVQILRIDVPEDTDLNHYFEVMNSRGEQLEKHEVLKAKLLGELEKIADPDDKKQSQHALHLVWEACSNMEKYIQSGFSPAKRFILFGQNWEQLSVANFDELRSALQSDVSAKTNTPETKKEETKLSIEQLIELPVGEHISSNEEDDFERFNSVINFPNFLLHVLRVILEKDVPLDDKRLLDSFDEYLIRSLTKEEAISNVKNFIYALFRCKYMFDYFVIKREFIKGKDSWSLKRYKKNSKENRAYYVNTFGKEDEYNDINNRQILMLLSAFHVSTPTMVYKHWLNGALYWLYQQKSQEFSATNYLTYLNSLAKAFVFDRFLGSENDNSEYFNMIYKNQGKCINHCLPADDILSSKLNYSYIANNLVFNYLDYLLWENKRTEDSKIDNFEFTFRSSVEHYYPQHPMQGYRSWDSSDLNSFGNLCLISHSKNSRLSNLMPKAKQDYYKANSIDSIKQYLMMKSSEWTVDEMKQHHAQMMDILRTAILEN